MDQEGEITDLGISQGQYPQLEGVEELPTVDILENLLGQGVSDLS